MIAQRWIVALGILALAAAHGRAQSTWVPTAGGTYTWNDANNWSPAGVPLAGTVNLNADIAGDQTITLDSSPNLTALNIGDLTITPNPDGAFSTIAITAGSGGPLQFAAASTLASQNSANVISAPITLNGGLTVTHLISAVPSPTPSQQVGSLTLSGPINLNGNTLTVGQTSSSLGRLDRGVVISGVMSGAGGLTKSAGGFLVLSGANEYTGPTTISAGAVRLVGDGKIGTGNLALSGGGQFFPGATFTRPIGTLGGEFQITGTGGFGAIDTDLVVNFGNAGAAIVWGSTGFTPTQFGLSSTSSNRTVTVVNPIDFNGAAREVRVDNGAAEVDAVLSGVLSGTAAAPNGFTKSGNGLLELTGVNTYTGVTRIGAEGVLRISNNSALGGTGTGNHTLILGGTRQNRLELSGGITVTEAIQIEGRGDPAHATAPYTNFSPALSNFSGNNTLTGNITFNNSGVDYNIESQSGLFTIQGAITRTTGTGGTTRTLRLTGAGDGLITGLVSNNTGVDPVAVYKGGTGTWTLAGATPHAYAGATTVNAGTLRVNGTLAAATAGVAVNTGGTLGGTGTINRAVTVAGGGTLAPGAGGAGVLTVANASGTAVTLQSGANFGVRITGGNPSSGTAGSSTDSVTTPTTNSVLSVTAGSVDINSGINIVVDGTGMSFTLGQPYSYQVGAVGAGLTSFSITEPTQFQFLGFSATQPSLVGDPSGAIFLTFTPVPEPGMVLLAGAIGLGLVGRWRARRSAGTHVSGPVL